MKRSIIISCFIMVLVVMVSCISTKSNIFSLNSHGNFRKMVHMKKTNGVVNLRKAIPAVNGYAVGAIQHGLGEITVINGEVWLDYGNDGIGNSVNKIPIEEKAVLLVSAKVSEWVKIEIPNDLSEEQLHKFIITKAKKQGLDTNSPFPFLLEGRFDDLNIHVINGKNPQFSGHGGRGHLFKQLKEKRNNQEGIVIGFYSANTQGVYTHPGESWHLHIAIKDENVGAHVDRLNVKKHTTLKLPKVVN